MGKTYLLGTDEHQAWQREYFFAPRGHAFLEPGVCASDSPLLAGMNVAKSFYQNYPEVFNIALVSEKTRMEPEEIVARLKRMYDERIIMFVKNSAVSAMGFGLWYWVVKMKENTPPEEKERLTNWIQENNEICTGYACDGGDFDFFCGNHMRVLDNLLHAIIEPIKADPWVESVHICPVRRDLRESSVNQFDIRDQPFRQYHLSQSAKERLLEYTDLVDEKDLAILDILNNTESIADMFDFDVLENLSGLDAEEMKAGLVEMVDTKHTVVPMIYLNFMKLGLNNHCYLVKLFQNVPSYRKEQIIDEIAQNPDFNNIFNFCDSYHDYMLMAYEELTDTEALKNLLLAYPEVEEIKEANSPRQFRRWTARLDDSKDMWEECVFTDDFLQNRMDENTPVCPLCAGEDK